MDLSAGQGTAVLIQPGDLPAVCQTPSKEECELYRQILLKDGGGVRSGLVVASAGGFSRPSRKGQKGAVPLTAPCQAMLANGCGVAARH